MIHTTEIEQFCVSLYSPERLMERAVERAREYAVNAIWNISESGYSLRKDIDFVRSTDSIVVKVDGPVMRGGMGGWSYDFNCSTWIERVEDDG